MIAGEEAFFILLKEQSEDQCPSIRAHTQIHTHTHIHTHETHTHDCGRGGLFHPAQRGI